MTEYLIREALPHDFEKVYAVFSLVDTLHREAHPEIFQEATDLSEIKDFLLAGIRSEDMVVFVAEKDAQIIAAIIAEIRQSADISLLVKRTYINVDNLVVDEEYRGQGVGQALMERVYLWAKKKGIKTIQLTVWDFNQGAKAFYEKLGYQMLNHRMRKELP